MNKKKTLIYTVLIASMGLVVCADNAYAGNRMEMTRFTCPAGYVCTPTHKSFSPPSPTLPPPPVKKQVSQPVQQYVPHFPPCPHGQVCQYHQQNYMTEHGKTDFVVNTPPPPGSSRYLEQHPALWHHSQ